MTDISASVGLNGKNLDPDVVIVQKLLNAYVDRLQLQPLKVDGKCGTKTITAITEFQRRIIAMKAPDGLVEPSGPHGRGRTLAALSSMSQVAPVAAKKNTFLTGKPVPAPVEKVLKEILQAAGLTSAKVNSLERTPAGQAQAMYELMEKHGFHYACNLYKEPGKKVAKVFDENRGKPKETVVALMTAKINELGPSTVSRHCSTTHYVVDIDPYSITVSKQDAFIKAVEKHKAVSTLLKPPSDPVYHIEIPKNRLRL